MTNGDHRDSRLSLWPSLPAPLRTAMLLGVLLGMLLGIPGCTGCLSDDPVAKKKREDEEKKKKLEKPKEDFELKRLTVQPRVTRDKADRNLVKGGHWMAATLDMKANNFDFQAEVEAASTNRAAQPFDIENTPFRMTLFRPATLPKGQTKQVELLYFVPDTATQPEGNRTVWLRMWLRARHSSRMTGEFSVPTTMMPTYRSFFITLAANSDGYRYLTKMDSIAPPIDSVGDGTGEPVRHYELVIPRIGNRVPLPAQPLTWTTIAYVLWDGLNPNLVSAEQQQALLDWLHWGGQLIVSGPDSLDPLQGSFLGEYLPARAAEACELVAADFKTFNEYWSPFVDRLQRRAELDLKDTSLVGVRLRPHPAAEYLPGANGLVAERRVGAGRIVVTAFSLSDRRLVNWPSYDSFFNGALLRRPPREYFVTSDVLLSVRWAGTMPPPVPAAVRPGPFPGRGPSNPFAGQTIDPQTGVPYQPPNPTVMAPTFLSGVRYFTRDVGTVEQTKPEPAAHSAQNSVAAWNENSGAAVGAREALGEAAGIAIPQAGFVLRVLAVYLAVLAPLNWGLFRLLRRVEWAWVAAPVIALVGAAAIVRLAQLDIGFVRSRTEVGVLEMQGGYPRGHLTRYTALYSSLSTHYDFEFDDPSAVALPFPRGESYQRGVHGSVKTVAFRREKTVSLTGFLVDSNSTGMVHSEQMYDAGGAIHVTGDADKGWKVHNDSTLHLDNVAVLWRMAATEPRHLVARVGSLPPGAAARLNFEDHGTEGFGVWSELMPETNRPAAEGSVRLNRLFDLVTTRRLEWRDGDMRLVGATTEDLTGLTISPQASQKQVSTMALVHLRRAALPTARTDSTLRVQVRDLGPVEPEKPEEAEKPEGKPEEEAEKE